MVYRLYEDQYLGGYVIGDSTVHNPYLKYQASNTLITGKITRLSQPCNMHVTTICDNYGIETVTSMLPDCYKIVNVGAY